MPDAQVLLAAGQRSAADYLPGYAVEFALKACIARMTNLHDIPERERVVKSYTHDVENLLAVAELRELRHADAKANPIRWRNGILVADRDDGYVYAIPPQPAASGEGHTASPASTQAASAAKHD